MLGDQFEVESCHFTIGLFIFNADIGNGNAVAHHAQAVMTCDLRPGVDAQLSDVLIDFPFQFNVENDARISSAFVDDPSSSLL